LEVALIVYRSVEPGRKMILADVSWGKRREIEAAPGRNRMKSLIFEGGPSIQQLIEHGFRMPIHFAAIGINGSVVAGTYTEAVSGEELSCEITVQCIDPGGLTAPVNIMCVDSRGASAVFVLRNLSNDTTTETVH
jgi:hypothetical protein